MNTAMYSKESLPEKRYWKITNQNECHHGFQYVNGLNILVDKFNDDHRATCVKGGLYFSDDKNIYNFLEYGVYLREVILPLDDNNFKMVEDLWGGKWRANMIILGKQYELSDKNTFGIITDNNFNIEWFRWAIRNNYLQIAKYLKKKGFCYFDDMQLGRAAENGHLDIVRFLVENGADIHIYDETPLKLATEAGHLNIVKYLAEHGANIHVGNNDILTIASKEEHLDIVKYLVENGVEINHLSLLFSVSRNRLDMFKYFVKKGANINDKCNELLFLAAERGNLEIIKCLAEKGAFIRVNERVFVRAIEHGHLDILQYLVGLGLHTKEIINSLLTKAFLNDQLDIVKYLVEVNADPKTINTSVLQHVFNDKKMRLIEYLIIIGMEIIIENDLVSYK